MPRAVFRGDDNFIEHACICLQMERLEMRGGFEWLRCEDQTINDCEAFFSSINVLTMSGRRFGVGAEFARVRNFY
ncbi:Allinase [Carex littledalei]|uniref:Allinase n=1 Tax=Carex littledalei TaxID=544730 RepID=A0A833R0N5_9POAL|nr:Allinase [Carex littledalei]